MTSLYRKKKKKKYCTWRWKQENNAGKFQLLQAMTEDQ